MSATCAALRDADLTEAARPHRRAHHLHRRRRRRLDAARTRRRFRPHHSGRALRDHRRLRAPSLHRATGDAGRDHAGVHCPRLQRRRVPMSATEIEVAAPAAGGGRPAGPCWATRMSSAPRRPTTEFDAPFQTLITEAAWGHVWSRDGLDQARALDRHHRAARGARPLRGDGDAYPRHRPHRRHRGRYPRGAAACRDLCRRADRQQRLPHRQAGVRRHGAREGRNERQPVQRRAGDRRLLRPRPAVASAGADAGLQDHACCARRSARRSRSATRCRR